MSEINKPLSPPQVSSQTAQKSCAEPCRTQRPLRIALFGFGTVGSSVARILIETKPEGLELTHIFNRNVARKRVDWVPASVAWSEDADAVLASDVDVVVELAGGLDPAGDWVRRALSGRQERGHRQQEADCFRRRGTGAVGRRRRGGHLKYGAAVAGGVPVIPGLEQGLAGDRIERIEGILNGTCNFILSKMEEGRSTRRYWPRRRPRAMPRPIPPRMWAALMRAPSWPS